MSADFTPNMESYKNPHYFRFWCQKVLPLVYDDSLSYYELLCKVVNYLNDVIADSDAMKTNIGNLLVAYNELQDYVNHYFDSLDVQTEINNKLDAMAESGELLDIIGPSISEDISQWLTEHITPTTPAVDSSLTVSGAAADSKTVGDLFAKTVLMRSPGSVVDANELPTGVYKINTDELVNWSNIPETNRGIMIESWVTDANSAFQFAYDFAYNDNTLGWYRKKSGGNWSVWLLLAGNNAVEYGLIVKETDDKNANTVETGLYDIPNTDLINWENIPDTATGIILESWNPNANTAIQRAVTFAYNVYPVAWTRTKSAGNWSAWHMEDLNANHIHIQISDIADANNFTPGTIFTTTDNTVKIANLPFSRVAVIVHTIGFQGSDTRMIQYCEPWAADYIGVKAVRVRQSNTWSDWQIIRDKQPNKKFGFTVITDSLGSGYIVGDTRYDYYEFSWPAYLGRRLGCEYYISGAGGQSAVQWMKSGTYGYNGLFARLPKTPVYFITLGTNDANQGVGQAAFKTAYRNIIAAVKAKQPNAIIFCMNLWRTGEPWTEYNGYLNEVLAEYSSDQNIIKFDITNEINSNAGVKAHLYQGHYDIIGYGLIARIILDKFIELTNEHPALFRQSFGDMMTTHPNQDKGFPYPY